jgi:hypothetical protein
MLRMVGWGVVGEIFGFVVLFGLFLLATPRHAPDFGIFVVFAVMGAIPVAAIAVFFAAVSAIRNEIRELSRQIEGFAFLEERLATGSSVQFRSSQGPSRD